MSNPAQREPWQHFPDDVASSHYRFTMRDDGPHHFGVDVTPDLEREIRVTPQTRLYTEQRTMSTAAVWHYRHGGELLEKLTISGYGEQRPVIVTYRMRHWLADGHHRIAASRLNGEPEIACWHVINGELRDIGHARRGPALSGQRLKKSGAATSCAVFPCRACDIGHA